MKRQIFYSELHPVKQNEIYAGILEMKNILKRQKLLDGLKIGGDIRIGYYEIEKLKLF